MGASRAAREGAALLDHVPFATRSGSPLKQLTTIGVHGTDLDTFLAELRDANVLQLLDVRQRRGVRGREYAWANSQRLQRALHLAGVEYRHHKELAPTTELRRLQYAEDDRLGIGKRSRVALAAEYVERYEREILDQIDLRPIVAEMPDDAATTLLCVERDATACHRSLIARRIAQEFGLPVRHLPLSEDSPRF